MPKRKGVLGVEVEAMEKQQLGSVAEIVQLEMKVGEEEATKEVEEEEEEVEEEEV